MITSGRNNIVTLLERIHVLLFGTAMSDSMRAFVGNIGVFGIGAFLAGIMTFLFSVLLGRVLGPATFGEYQLALSLSGIFFLPMVFGMNTALIRHIAPIRNEFATTRILFNTATTITLILTAVTAAVLIAIENILAPRLQVTTEIYRLGVLIAVMTALLYPVKGMVHALQRFRFGSLIEIIGAAATLGAFALLLLTETRRTANIAVIAQVVGLGTAILLSAVYLRRFFSFAASRAAARTLMGYGAFAAVTLFVSFLLANVDRLTLNYFLDPAQVGIYVAYVSAATFFSSAFLQIFSTVLFPALCAQNDKRAVLDKLGTLAKKLGFALIIFNFLAIPIVLSLYGKNYPFVLSLSALLAVSVTLAVGWQIYGVFLNSEGIRGIRLTTAISALGAVLLIVCNVVFIPVAGMRGAVLAGLAVNLTLFLVLRSSARRYALHA